MSLEILRIPNQSRVPLTVRKVLVAGNRGPCGGVKMVLITVNSRGKSNV